MRTTSFYSVPTWKAVFKVTADCCYEKVVYEGEQIGVTGKIDHVSDGLNSWDLQCYDCNPSLSFIPISAKLYYTYKNNTMETLRKRKT